jgi:predicted RNase H-like nuclease (RuvC/YqgF family)
MCGANIRFFIYLFIGLLLASVAGVLRGEEPGQWYLISEAELQSIEEYRNKSETEKQTWLLQVQRLKAQADSLREESRALNNQLSQARDRNRELQRSFKGYEAGQLSLISLKNGEIADLKQEKADKTLETEKYRGIARSRLVIIIALGAATVRYIAFKVCRFFRLF